MNLPIKITGRYMPAQAIEVCWYYANWSNARCVLYYKGKLVMTYKVTEYPTWRTLTIKYRAGFPAFTMAGLTAKRDWTIWGNKWPLK